MSHYQTARRHILDSSSLHADHRQTVPPVVKEKKKERKENLRMVKRMITGNEIENSCRDVRTGDIWSDVIASVVPDVSKERNASIFNGQEFKKAVI